MEKKKRAKNFSDSEIALFTDILLPKYGSFIENKKTDAVTRKEKSSAWTELCAEFNAISNFCFQTEENLKNLWEKLKKNARKARAHERCETFATGGGSRDTKGDPTPTGEKVLELIGPSGVGLFNHCDWDAVESSDENNITMYSGDAASTDAVVIDATSIDFGGIEVPHQVTEQQVQNVQRNWQDVVPRMLYYKKPDAIRPGSSSSGSGTASTSNSMPESAPTSSKSSGSPCSAGSEAVRKRTVAEELELAKQMKRRRPTLNENKESNQENLTKAKVDLAEATRKRLEDKDKKRNKELFEIEKEKKLHEVELARLQVLKMKRDLGLE